MARLRFSLKTLLVVVGLISVLLACLGRPLSVYVKERIVVNRLIARGGNVEYEGWRVAWVWLPIVDEETIGELNRLGMLRTLACTQGRSKEGNKWACLAACRNIEELVLFQANVGDDDLEYVAALPQLRSLGLGYTHVTDAGVARLRGVSSLEVIDLEGTAITGRCVRDVCEMKQLTWLNVERTQLSSTDVAKIKEALPKCDVVH